MQARIMWRRRVLAWSSVAALSLVIVACSGSNLFQAQAPLPPVVTALTAADTARAGQPFEVQVTATAQQGVSRLDFSLLGAAVVDTSVDVSPAQFEVNRAVIFTMPDTLLGHSLTVSATAADSAGITSTPKTVTVPAVGPTG